MVIVISRKTKNFSPKSFSGFQTFILNLNLNFLDFAFLCATLKASLAPSTCCIHMVDKAFERSCLKVFEEVMIEWQRRLEISV